MDVNRLYLSEWWTIIFTKSVNFFIQVNMLISPVKINYKNELKLVYK